MLSWELSRIPAFYLVLNGNNYYDDNNHTIINSSVVWIRSSEFLWNWGH